MSAHGISILQRKFIIESVKKCFPESEIIFFGSRSNGSHRIDSDLDLCIRNVQALPLASWEMLSQDLIESDLPFKVDLSDWHRIQSDFRKVILATGKVWGA